MNPPPNMLSPRLCLSPGPVSCAAAGQRWVTRPVNDKSRLGRKLEQTEVRRRRPVILRGEGGGGLRGCAGCAVVCRFGECFCEPTERCVYF